MPFTLDDYPDGSCLIRCMACGATVYAGPFPEEGVNSQWWKATTAHECGKGA